MSQIRSSAKAAKKKVEGHFDPVPAMDLERIRTGTRKVFEKSESFPLKWPQDKKGRYDLFDAWHDVAMQIIHREKIGFRMMAVSKKVIRWSLGAITDSNAELASRAGYCSEKTISREIQAYADLGLFISELTWKRPGGRKFITVRALWPSLPKVLPDGIVLPDLVELSLDNSGPDLGAISLDNSGPEGMDTRGPATIETIRRGTGDAA
jgi:hypothetical protein